MVIAILIVVKYQRRSEHGSSPIGVALICYGVLFAATITQGRAFYGLFAPSRYSTCGLLILAGCYLALLDRAPARSGFAHRATTTEDRPERRNVIGQTVIWIGLAVAIFLQVIFGTGHGLASAKSWSQSQKEVADTIVNVGKSSNQLVQIELFGGNPLDARQLVQTMKVHRLSLFATGAVGYYSRIGLLPELTVIQVRVIIPVGGATLKGTCVLDASASDLSGVTKVDFRLNGDGVHDTVIGVGKPTYYGWIGSWNTFGTANGAYELQSVAYGYGGKTSYSRAVRVTISNQP
jgi:hypothetical protein